MSFAAGQRWTYRAPLGFESSRIVIGAVITFPGGDRVVCTAVSGAPVSGHDGTVTAATIPFLPLSEPAFRATVLALDGLDVPPEDFQQSLDTWSADPRGLSMFTVPFEGSLGRLIALQMAQIASAPTPPAS